jgi:hypothetical protein
VNPILRPILKHLIGAPKFMDTLGTIDGFVARETGGVFKTMLELSNRKVADASDQAARDSLLRRIRDALEDDNLFALEKHE